MEIWGDKRLFVFIKILTSLLLPLGLSNIFIVLARVFMNLDLYQNNDKYIFTITIFMTFLWSLIVFNNYLYKSKSIKIDNRLLAKENIKMIMKKMKWKIVDIDENIFTFRYPFYREFKSFKITIRFIDTEVIISGPEEYVDKAIEKLKSQSL